jgi:hypothetical protein
MRYGSYFPHEYRNALRRACLVIGFSLKESQGIAWVEAWSVDVPTLLWNQDYITYKGRRFRCSTGPYLTEHTGVFFYGLKGFAAAFELWEQTRDKFRPRPWVLENMSDEVRARALCELGGLPVPEMAPLLK